MEKRQWGVFLEVRLRPMAFVGAGCTGGPAIAGFWECFSEFGQDFRMNRIGGSGPGMRVHYLDTSRLGRA